MKPLEGVRILVVEDDDDTREVMRVALEARGASLVCVASARAALEALQQTRPDILLSDIAMPEVDGHTLLRQFRSLIRKRGWRIPAVAITAFDTREARLASRDSGFHYHLSKPVDPDKLVDIVLGLVRLTRG